MTKIELKYDLDIDEVFAKLKRVNDALNQSEGVIQAMRSQNPFMAATQSAQGFNTQLGQSIQIFQRVGNSTSALRAELARMQGVYTQLRAAQSQFTAPGQYAALNTQLTQTQGRIQQIQTQLGQAATQAHNLSNTATPGSGSFFGGVGGVIGKIAGLAGATFSAAEIARRAITDYAAYGKALSDLSAITGATGKDLAFLDDQAQQLSSDTGIAAIEIINGFKAVGSIQPDLLNSKEALAGVTKEVVALSQASGLDLTDAAKATLGSLNQFGEGADQAGRFVNVLAAGALKGASEVNDTAAALQNAGTAVSAAGLSFEQGNAVIQSLAGIMIKGSEAGTGLRNVLLKLETASDKNLRPSVVGLDTALENASKKFNTTTALTKEFGTENIIVAKRILDTRGEISQLTTDLTGTSVAYDQARIQTDNLATDLTKAGNSITGFFTALGASQGGALRTITQNFTAFVNSVSSKTGTLKAFFSEIFSSSASLANPFLAVGNGIEAYQRQKDANAVVAARNARVNDIKSTATGRVKQETESLTKEYTDQGEKLPAAQRKAADEVKKARDEEYAAAVADHQRLRKEYEQAGKEERDRLGKTSFDASRARLLAATTAKQTADDAVKRFTTQDAKRADALASANGEAPSDEAKAKAKKAAADRLKAMQDEQKLLTKASEEYLKEINSLEDKYGKSRLERLDKDSEDYINEKAGLDKEEIEQERIHLEKLLQLAASSKTKLNKQTGEREVVADTSITLAKDAPALSQQFEDRKTAVDVAAARARKLQKIREESELLELDKSSYSNELKLYDLKTNELLAKEAEGSAKYDALVEKRIRDRATLGLGLALEQAEQDEQVRQNLNGQLTQNSTERAVDFEKRKQQAILKVVIDAAQKRIDILVALGEKENVVQISALRTAIKGAQAELAKSENAPTQFKDIFDALGVYAGMSEDNVAQFQGAVSTIKDAISGALSATIDASDQRINAIQNEISAKEEQVNEEESRAKEGSANNLKLRQDELDDLKRQKAEEQQVKREAQQEQALIDEAAIISANAVTVANLIAAAAKAFEAYSGIPFLGIALSLAAAATIYSTIASVKAKAKTLAQLREGGEAYGMPHELAGIQGTGSFGHIQIEGGERVTKKAMSAKFRETLVSINNNDPRAAFRALAMEGFGMSPAQWHQSLMIANQPVAPADKETAALLREVKDVLGQIKDHTKPGPQYVGLGDGRVMKVEPGKITIKTH